MAILEQLRNADPEYPHQLDVHLLDWYKLNRPWDDIWIEIDPKATFRDLRECLQKGGDVYECISGDPNDVDSLAREALFGALAEMLGVDYDVIYYAWLGSEPPADRLRIVIDMRKGA